MKHIAILILLLAVPAVGQFQQTVPAGHLTPVGGAGSSFPFNNLNDHTWQWHYDSAQFTATFPIVITEVSVSGLNGAPLPNFDFPSLEVVMASSPTDYTLLGNGVQGGHDPTFANNLNSDMTIVRPAAPWVGGAATWQWHAFGLTTPFVYDPTQGNDLVVQLRKCGTNVTFGTSIHGQSGAAGINGANRYGDQANCAATGSVFNNNEYCPVIMIDYTPAMGLYAGFSWTGSQANEIINFSDQSYSSSAGGILGWSWDFGDGTNSSAQNPVHFYACPGTYNVTLTVVDGIFSPSTVTIPVTITDEPFVGVSTPGSGDLLLTPPRASCYPTAVAGYTLYTFATTPGSVGGGPIFGIIPDASTFAGVAGPRLVGSPLNFIVAPGIYPDAPLALAGGTLAGFVGSTVDAVLIYQDVTGALVHYTNVTQIAF